MDLLKRNQDPRKGRILVWCDGFVDVSGLYPDELHATFGLSSFEESVVLSDSSGRIIDAVDYSGIGTDASYARQADAPGRRRQDRLRYENTDEGYAAFAQQEAAATNGGGLLLSEVMAAKDETFLEGEVYYDWIELYNGTGETVDLWLGLVGQHENPEMDLPRRGGHRPRGIQAGHGLGAGRQGPRRQTRNISTRPSSWTP